MPKKTTSIPVKKMADDAPDEDAVVTPPERPTTTPLPKASVVKSDPRRKTSVPVWVWWASGAAVVLIAAVALGMSLFGGDTTDDATTNTNTVTNTNTTQLIPRVIDGVPVVAERANTNIFAVVVENMVDARPQSGLDEASVVYETLAEGGITRFLALYPVGSQVQKIGPVRSARPYFISWSEEYKPLFAHAGGSPQALAYLRTGKANLYDFNQFSNGGSFVREPSRSAPHNLYTDTDKLFMGLRRKAPDASANFSSWTFKGETPLDNRPTTVNDLVIDFSSFSYKVKYQYDRVQNRYVRYQADKPHVMLDGAQIYAKNVVIQYTTIAPLAGDKQRLDIKTVGSGKALVFRDGTVIEGTWKKESAADRTEFLDANNQPIALNAGQIWIETVATGAKVTY